MGGKCPPTRYPSCWPSSSCRVFSTNTSRGILPWLGRWTSDNKGRQKRRRKRRRKEGTRQTPCCHGEFGKTEKSKFLQSKFLQRNFIFLTGVVACDGGNTDGGSRDSRNRSIGILSIALFCFIARFHVTYLGIYTCLTVI